MIFKIYLYFYLKVLFNQKYLCHKLIYIYINKVKENDKKYNILSYHF